MSVCLCSFRALSRSRAPHPKTLAPFLYQTATIQQRTPASRRHASSQSNSEDDVPFEGDGTPVTLDHAKTQRNTTITGSERAAFEKLYKKFQNPKAKDWSDYEVDAIADEYYEDDDDNNSKKRELDDTSDASIDSLFDAVLSKRQPQAPPRARGKGLDLGALAADVLRPEAQRAREKAAARNTLLQEIRDNEKKRMRGLMEAAKTDKELWEILDRDVFGVIRAMDLDAQKDATSEKGRRLSKPKATTRDPLPPDPDVVLPIFSYHLIVAAQLLRTKFPASPLVFNIVPALKDLGPSSYALGATTSLYKVLIRAAWLQNHSYSQICALLQEMDNGGIEHDEKIVTLLDIIIAEHSLARRKKLGQGMKAVLGLELYVKDFERLLAWHRAIRKSMGIVSEEKRQRGTLIRKASYQSKTVYEPKDRPKGPWRATSDAASANDDIPLVEEPLSDETMADETPEMAGQDSDASAGSSSQMQAGPEPVEESKPTEKQSV